MTGRKILILAAITACAVASRSLNAADPVTMSDSSQKWNNPMIRPWQDYPFFDKPPNTLHKELWQDFKDLPENLQRGRLIYGHEIELRKYVDRKAEDPDEAQRVAIQRFSKLGYSLVHYHCPSNNDRELTSFMRKTGMAPTIRLDGKHFFGNYDIWRISDIRSGVSPATGYAPNHDWYRKFPPSLIANAVLRDGQPAFEYYGSACTQRRTLNLMHPITLQVRDAFLRTGLLGEKIFDEPQELKAGGFITGAWWDNPNNQVPSFDAYSREYTEKAFRHAFGDRMPAKFEAWLAQQPKAVQRACEDPQRKAALFSKEFEQWYSDPAYFFIKHHDREVMEWWIGLWADAHAGYWSWQYRFLQDEIAPKLKARHVFVGGNFKLCTPRAAWDYYAFSWPISDILGPGESAFYYSRKHAPGYKMGLAASNGKQSGLWGCEKDRQAAESVACLGASNHMPEHYVRFQSLNVDLFHNAKPGGRVAYLYHLEDGLLHNEVANMCRLADQIWKAGVPYEAITERHLTPRILDQFSMIIVPGFRFNARDVAGLKSYVVGGGNLLLIGDNRDRDDKPLAQVLAGMDPWKDGDAEVGKGRVRHLARQLVTQQQMTDAVEALGGADAYRIVKPAGQDILINVLRRPKGKITSVHLVNFTDGPIPNVTVQLPPDLGARHVALVSPYGIAQDLPVTDNRVTVPELSVYAALVVSPNARAQKKTITRNHEAGFEPLAKWPEEERLRHGRVGTQFEIEDLGTGEQLCHLRETGRCDIHRLEADAVAPATVKAGQPCELKLRVMRVGVHSPPYVHIDKIKWVLVDLESEARVEVPVEMVLQPGEKAEDVTVVAASFLRRDTVTSWVPDTPGRYQAYLSYRYVSEAFEGKPEPTDPGAVRTRKKTSLEGYFWSVPMLKMVYEDRLPGMVLEVTQ